MPTNSFTQRDSTLIIVLLTLAILAFILAGPLSLLVRMLLFMNLISAFILAPLGSKRKIGFLGAFAISFFASPLTGIIFIFNSTKLQDEAYQERLFEVSSQLASSSSVADQLHKLNELRKDGVLTDDEFESQKYKLLNS